MLFTLPLVTASLVLPLVVNVTIVSWRPKKLSSISWFGPYNKMHNILKLFQQFEARVDEIRPKTEEDMAFICPFHDRKTDFTYYVTVEVENFEHVPNGMVGVELPEQFGYPCSVLFQLIFLSGGRQFPARRQRTG